MYPKITHPCPFRVSALPDAERNFCTHCERKVHNLDLMSADARREFLGNRSGKVCVAYTVPVSRVKDGLRASVVVAAALLGSGVSAQDVGLPEVSAQPPVIETSTGSTDAVRVGGVEGDEEMVILAGGVESATETAVADDRDLPEPPVLRRDAPELEFVVAPKESTRR